MRGSVVDSVRRRRGPAFLPTAWAVTAVLALVALISPMGVAAESPGTPSEGIAVVDGAIGEWDLSADHFADMADAGRADRPIVARLYLRYDCASQTLFGLVKGVDGARFLQTRPEEAYLRVDGAGKLVSGLSGNDGVPPDFAWLNPDGTLTDGFEASGSLAPGSHTIRGHILQLDQSADGYAPIDNIGQSAPLDLECPQPTPMGDVGSATGTPTVTPTPTQTQAGDVGSATGTPTVTLPPTATDPSGSPPAGSWQAVLLGLALLTAGTLVLTPMPGGARRRR